MSRVAVDLVRALSASKNIESPLLNTLGLQVGRMLAARGIYALRRWPAGRDLEERAATLRRDGILVWNDFLPRETFIALREEGFRALTDRDAKRSVRQHGPNRLEQASLLTLPESRYPHLRAFLDDPRLTNLICSAEKRPVDFHTGHRSVERLEQGSADEYDEETGLHIDTFFHTHKAWLYLDDVSRDIGAFVYVPGSHRLNLHRVRRTYEDSVGLNRGSRRISEEELAAQGLTEMVVECPANTLVVANTAGYHRRTRGIAGRQRRALHLAFRYNPFWPRRVQAENWLSRRNPWVRRALAIVAPDRAQ